MFISFTYYKKALGDYIDNKFHILVASIVIIQGIDMNKVINMIDYNTPIYAKIFLSTNIK